MTVYVDNMRAPFRRMIMCHMVADAEPELHAMADTIGVARRWYQGDHYDVCLDKRALAVAAGAVEITLRECGAMTVRARGGLPPLPPAEALEWLCARARERAAAVVVAMGGPPEPPP